MLFIARVFWLCQGWLALKWPSAGRYMTLITVEIRFQGSIPTSLRWPVSMHLPQLTAGVSSCGWWANTRNKSSTRASGKEGYEPGWSLVQGASVCIQSHSTTEAASINRKQSCSQEGLFIPCVAKFREDLASIFPDDFVSKKLIFVLSLYVGYTFKSLSIALFRIICMITDS